jgi:caffeic acid 3-O-methyltransferase
MKQHPERNLVMNRTMTGFSKATMPALLNVYGPQLDDIHVLVDIGGGVGASLGIIIARYPHIKGINFDQPHVIAIASPLLGELSN